MMPVSQLYRSRLHVHRVHDFLAFRQASVLVCACNISVCLCAVLVDKETFQTLVLISEISRVRNAES